MSEKNEKPYVFRRLSAKDILPMAKIINLVGVNKFQTILQGLGSSSDEDDLVDVGIGVFLNIANVILEGYEKCEKELFLFLASVSGLKLKELQELDLSSFAEMLDEFMQKEELGDFIKVVSRLLPMGN